MLYVGIDHSLSALGLAATLPDWGLDPLRVRRRTLRVKPELGPLPLRRAALADDVAVWIEWHADATGTPKTEIRAFIESGIFNATMVDTIRSQERLAAVIEDRLFRRLGVTLEIAQQRSVRSTFMGKAASGGRGAGDAAQAGLVAVWPDAFTWDEAELDAALIMNHGLSLDGHAFVSIAPDVAEVEPPKVKKPSKRRSRAQLELGGRP